jgi:uncharacterized Ntn-hydrolase superfamily protein
MTFSLLAQDPGTGALGGAATTGSLCVGGWVLRGDSRWGLSASQGAAPSTMWGEEAITRLGQGMAAEPAVAAVTGPDTGRAFRQLSVLDAGGGTAAFTGEQNTRWRGALCAEGLVAAGNLLTGPEVLEAAIDGFRAATGPFPDRLIAALEAGRAAGGDKRGLQSAALLVLSDDAPPLTLRIDWAENPVAALSQLLGRTRKAGYADWLPCVPTRNDPERGWA